MALLPSYNILNLTNSTLTIDNVTLQQNQSADILFKSSQVIKAESLGLISVASSGAAVLTRVGRLNEVLRACNSGLRPLQIKE